MKYSEWKEQYVDSPVVVDQTQKITKKKDSNAYSVDRKLVNSKEYHDKFESLTSHKSTNESVYQEAMKMLEVDPDIILLDVNMPQFDGMEVCRRIRDKVACPILFLTARVDEQDRVNGLLSGGDDYILKPFSLKELDARITAHLKREERHKTKSEYSFQGELLIDYTAKTVQINGNDLELTKLEYGIIEFLSMNPGLVFDKERIYEKVCGYDGEGDSRVVTELIRRIRKKMSLQTEKEYIETVWGMGYKWTK